jgi:hypothetical protein
MAYKNVAVESTVGEALSALDDLRALQEEMQSWADNMQGTSLENTEKYQRVEEAATTLEAANNIDEVNLPEDLSSKKITYSKMQNRNKKAPNSRAVRCTNAAVALRMVVDEIRDWVEEKQKELDEADDGSDLQTLSDYADEIENVCDDAENVEFPGMFG